MKGMSNAILAAFFLIFLVAIAFSSSVLWFGKTSIYETTLFRPVYIMQNALEAAKYAYVKPALRYSFYQACFDNMRRGGWNTEIQKNVISHGENNYYILADEKDFFSALKNETKKNLRVYTNRLYTFILNEEVEMPDYDIIKIKPWSSHGTPMVNVNITSTNQLFHDEKKIESQNETIRLYLSPNINETFSHNFYSLFKRALQENKTVSAALDAFEKYMKQWPTTHIYRKTIDSGNVRENYTNAVFYDMIISERPSLVSGESFSKSNPIHDAITILKNKIGIDDRIKEVQDGDFKIVSESLMKEVLIKNDGCPGSSITEKNGKISVDMTCKFNYSAYILAKINITDTDTNHLYPVYNGTNVSFEPLTIEFAVQRTIKHNYD